MNKEIDINNLNPEFLNEDLQNSIIEYKGRLYINHLLCQNFYKEIEPFAETSNNACVNFQYLTTLKLYRKYLKLKDYDGVLNILEKQKKMEWFLKNYKKVYQNIGNKKFYEMFSWLLTYVDHHYPYRKKYSEIIKIGKNPRLMMSKEEKKHFLKLSNKCKIYRGICYDSKLKQIEEKDRELLIGNSWTLDYEQACWFAKNHATKYYPNSKYKKYILSYDIDKKDIIAYFKDRKEEEVFINFKSINLKKIMIIRISYI